jgi:hypothetical protein
VNDEEKHSEILRLTQGFHTFADPIRSRLHFLDVEGNNPTPTAAYSRRQRSARAEKSPGLIRFASFDGSSAGID